MTRFLGILAASACLSISGPTAKGDEKDVAPILDKAIAALGGEAKLAKGGALSWKAIGTLTFNENEAAITSKTLASGVDRQKGEFELDFNGNAIKGVTVLAGAKGWRKFNDEVQDLEGDMLAGARQAAYLAMVPKLVVPLKSKDFKVEAAPDEKVGDKLAAVLKATGPDGKPFTLAFDKETGLPLRMKATVRSFQGEDVAEETTFDAYKDFDGVKRATKVVSKRGGSPYLVSELSDFQIVAQPDPAAFAEPK